MSLAFAEEYDVDLIARLSRLRVLLQENFSKRIEDAGLVIHSFSGRVKSRPSLERKLARPDRTYKHLLDVTDLLAFRLITYSEDVIDDVAKLIENAFELDFENSVNKLHQEDSQKFGYRSLHYVCFVPEGLEKEVAHYGRAFKFEVQIRTILQHTWAEIEHDVGYKAVEQLPREFRRRFSQIASLLEVADREFASIRTDLKSYGTKLKQTNFQEEQIELDSLSLQSILDQDEMSDWDREVSAFMKVLPSKELFYPDYLLCVLRAAGLKRVGDVLKVAEHLKGRLQVFLPVYFDFAKKQWGLDLDSIPEVQKGYGLLFLAHLHVLETEDLLINKLDRLTKFYRDMDYPEDVASAKAVAQALISALKSHSLIQER